MPNKENTGYLFVIYEWCSAHGLLYLHGLTLRILKKKNSRPDFQKIILRKSQVNSRLFRKYSRFLSK